MSLKNLNLSLDDFSPHPKAGLNFESIKWCNDLIKKHPDIKINLFVPAAYCRLGEKPCYLRNYPDWVKKVNELPDNYRIGLHGFYHRRHPSDLAIHKLRQPSNNDEWQYLNLYWAKHLFDSMIEEFKIAGLKYNKVFRPPGWKISESATRVLMNEGFIIAGNSEYYKIYKNKISGLKWVSYNWDLLSKCNIKGDVLAFGHTSSWTNNYFDEKRFNLVCDLLDKERFEFKFLEEL